MGKRLAKYARHLEFSKGYAQQVMRVLFLNDRIPPENRGGAGEIVWRVASAFRDAGHDVHIVAATEKAAFTDIRVGIPTYHLHVKYPLRWRAWLSLYNPQVNQALHELYQHLQPDIINAHNIHQDLTYHSMSIAHRMSIPVVFSSHDVMPFAYQKLSPFVDRRYCAERTAEDYRLPIFYNLKQMRFRYNPFRNMVIRYILKKHVQARTAPSHELCTAHQVNGLAEFTCVHNGIDAEKFQASAQAIQALKQRLRLEGCKVILFAGRLTGAKGLKPLLEALKIVTAKIPETRLLILSSIPIEEKSLNKNKFPGASKYIKLGGWLSGQELAAAYHLADVVTVPSLIFDTFPTVNLEAMITKTPVIATCYGGSHEAVIDGETGYIINPFDSQSLADSLLRLLSDEVLCQKMGQAGYDRVVSHFTMQKQVDSLLTIFQAAIAHKRK